VIDRRGFLGALGLGALAARLGPGPEPAAAETDPPSWSSGYPKDDPSDDDSILCSLEAERIASRIRASGESFSEYELELILKDRTTLETWYRRLESQDVFELTISAGAGKWIAGVFVATFLEDSAGLPPIARVRSVGRVELFLQEGRPATATPYVGCRMVQIRDDRYDPDTHDPGLPALW